MNKEKAFGIIVLITNSVCFATSGMDFAMAVKHISEKEPVGTVIFILLGIWLFVQGYTNMKKVLKELRKM